MPFTDEQAVHALTVLTRLGQREQDVGQWIVDALLRDPARLVGPALRVAVETGQPMGVLLDRVLRETDLPTEVLLAAQASIPPYTTVLRSTAAIITGILLERGVGTGTPEHAGLAIQHAERLLETGDRVRATEVAADAVRAAGDHPERLLDALRVLSACHSASGDHRAALRTAQRAVHALTDLDIRSPRLAAMTWHTLGMRQLNAGRPAAAVAAFDRAETQGRLAIDRAAGDRGDVGGAYHALALLSIGQAQALIDAGRAAEALAPAMRAVKIIRERAAESPDAHAVDHAQAVLIAARAFGAGRPPAEAGHEWEPLVAELPAAALELCQDMGRRRDTAGVRQYAALAARLYAGFGPAALAGVVGSLVDLGLQWLDNIGGAPGERDEVAAAVIEAAVAAGQPLAGDADEGRRLMFQRALVARSRLRERTTAGADAPGADAPGADAAGADAAGADAAGAVGAAREAVAFAESGPVLARAVAAHSLATRLANAGQAAEAARAEADAVRHLASVYEPDRADQVFAAAAMTARLLTLADDLGGLPDDLVGFAVSLLTSYQRHRAADTVLDNLAITGFQAVMVYVRRGDADGAARAHRALGALADATGHATVRQSRVLVAFNALRCHLRAGRIDLAVEAYEDVARDSAGGGDEQVVEQAKCANALINVYVDTDFDAARALVVRAGPALRSSQYIAVLPSLGEDDPPGYLQWLDQIEAGTGTADGADRATLEALEADYRTTVAQRRRDYGEDHEATLAARVKFADVLHRLGRTAEARTELEAVLDASRRLRGPDHEDTRALQDRLDSWC